jgi:hypothetical protein
MEHEDDPQFWPTTYAVRDRLGVPLQEALDLLKRYDVPCSGRRDSAGDYQSTWKPEGVDEIATILAFRRQEAVHGTP